jgi:hypothetical protein
VKFKPLMTIVKALDFMTGAGSTLPNITERKGYDRCWLELDLPKTGRVTLARALAGGGFALHLGSFEPGTDAKPDRTLAAAHATKTQKSESLSGFLLNELGVVDRKVARKFDGATSPFTFRYFAPYVFTEETAMMGETSPIKIDAHTTDTLAWISTARNPPNACFVPSPSLSWDLNEIC